MLCQQEQTIVVMKGRNEQGTRNIIRRDVCLVTTFSNFNSLFIVIFLDWGMIGFRNL